MTFDSYGFICMEQNGFPGSIGDSCAETSRYAVLMRLCGYQIATNFDPFITDKGILRHPTSPWREDDTSDDQVFPLIAAVSLIEPELLPSVIERLTRNGLRTGNGELVHLGTVGQLLRAKGWANWVSDLVILGQALIFKLPYRWDDGKKTITKSEGSSADYLNFINYLAFAKITNTYTWPCRKAFQVVTPDIMIRKVNEYYKSEPNNSLILNLYTTALSKLT